MYGVFSTFTLIANFYRQGPSFRTEVICPLFSLGTISECNLRNDLPKIFLFILVGQLVGREVQVKTHVTVNCSIQVILYLTASKCNVSVYAILRQLSACAEGSMEGYNIVVITKNDIRKEFKIWDKLQSSEHKENLHVLFIPSSEGILSLYVAIG